MQRRGRRAPGDGTRDHSPADRERGSAGTPGAEMLHTDPDVPEVPHTVVAPDAAAAGTIA